MGEALKIAVLYITLGRYDIFFDGFYKSAKKYLLPGHEKQFFVFTDSKRLLSRKEKDITVIERKKLGWPYDTLMRFEMFSSIKDKLIKFDNIFFFNSNMIFIRPVGEEILPSAKNGWLAAATFFVKNPDEYTYDRNPDSRAYIPYGKGRVYYQGGLNGGRAAEYLEMVETLKQWVDEDIQKGVIAKWNDESYLNKYFLDKNPLIIQRNYMFPQEWSMKDCPGKLMAMLRDKANPFYGGTKWLRSESDRKVNPVIEILKKPLWFLKIMLKYFRI